MVSIALYDIELQGRRTMADRDINAIQPYTGVFDECPSIVVSIVLLHNIAEHALVRYLRGDVQLVRNLSRTSC